MAGNLQAGHCPLRRPSASATAGWTIWPPSHVEAGGQGRVGGHGVGQARRRASALTYGQGGVGEGVGRRVGHGAGDVAHAVVDHAVRARRSARGGWSRGWSRRSRPGRRRRRRSPHRASWPAPGPRCTRVGARPPATSTAPITRSAFATVRSMVPWFEASVVMRPLWIWSTKRRRSRSMSSRLTSASMPAAIHAAFQPDVAGAEHDHPARAARPATRRAARPGRRCGARGSGRRSAPPCARPPRSSAPAAAARPTAAARSRRPAPVVPAASRASATSG